MNFIFGCASLGCNGNACIGAECLGRFARGAVDPAARAPMGPYGLGGRA